MNDNRPLSEVYEEAIQAYRKAYEEWTDADHAATILQDCKSAVLAEKMLVYADMAVNKAEMLVKGGNEWREYVEGCVKAQKVANLAKIRSECAKLHLETIRMRFGEWQSQEANERVQARL